MNELQHWPLINVPREKKKISGKKNPERKPTIWLDTDCRFYGADVRGLDDLYMFSHLVVMCRVVIILFEACARVCKHIVLCDLARSVWPVQHFPCTSPPGIVCTYTWSVLWLSVGHAWYIHMSPTDWYVRSTRLGRSWPSRHMEHIMTCPNM